jgi:putative solute:sodium symporter small subunit
VATLSPEDRIEHWRRTRQLMIIHLVVWFFFSYVVHWFAVPLNNISFFGWPLGYYMAAQGSLIAFVVQLFLFNRQQHAIDVKFGVAEVEEE